ncbi:glucose dehydrogenase [Roseivivax halodurans JCM 10272]|uniref:Glucose dehydrogenase n=1 Tax=Roseivivax halodurans JCM 10272 TaxID=1449350 RepID=X7E553_9RHOB|nr:hypothetical protein [Roseivivax halodurans]ETX11194.1 glucose dehydrogenase [Roseivivax halodurans JCM 10272]
MSHSTTAPPKRKAGAWAVKAVAVVLAFIGIVLLGGGVYLILLGGSWYYAVAGALLLASGVFLFRMDRTGVLIYAVTWAITLAWTVWEIQFDWWAWVPRMVAPTVLLVLVLLCLPALGARRSAPNQVA